MENTTVIFKVDFGDTAQKAVDISNKIEQLATNLGEARQQFGANSKEVKILEAELKANRAQLGEYNKTLENGSKILQQQDDSLKQMKIRLTEQRKAYSELSKAERENADVGVKQAANIKALQQEIKELELGLGNTAVNVGNYQEAVEKAFDNKATGIVRDFKDSIGGAIGAFKGVGQASKDAGGGIAGIGAATKVGFGAVLIIIQALIGLFSGLAESFEPFRIVLAEVQAVGKALFATFTEGLYAIVEAIKAPSKAFEIFSKFADEAGERIGDAAKNAGELERRTIAVEKAQRKVNVAVAQLSAEVEKQEKIADNQAKSFAERQDAIGKAFAAEKVRGNEVLKLEKEKLSIIEGRLKIEPRSKDLLDQQAEAQVRIVELQGQQEAKLQDIQNKSAELNRSQKDLALSIQEGIVSSQIEATKDIEKQYALRLKLLQVQKAKELNAESISNEQRLALEKKYQLDAQALRRQFTTQRLSESLEASVLEIEAALKNTEAFSDEAFKLQSKLIERRLKAEINAINQEAIGNELKLAKIDLATQNSLNERLKLNKDYEEKLKQSSGNADEEELAKATKQFNDEKALAESRVRANKLELELKAADEFLSQTERSNAKIKLLEMEQTQALEIENLSGEERAAINKKYDKQIAQERATINQDSVNTTLQQFQGLTAGLSSLFEQAKQVELNQAGDSAEKRAAIEKKYAERVRAIRMFEIVASTAAAIIKTLAEPALLFPSNVITAGIIGATGAVQLAAVATQKFADGGYTGSGYGSPDETGYKPAGIVHEGEYVVPKRVVNSNPSLIGMLENKRLGKYADGGLVTNTQLNNAQGFNYDRLAQSVAKIKVVTEVQAFQTAETNRNRIVNQATY